VGHVGYQSAAELNAALYDLRGITWSGEMDFYRRHVAQGGSATRVLEVACGTGRVAIELARDGFDVTGFDHSNEMLAVARTKVADTASPRFMFGDMRTFELRERFDIALIPGHSFQFMTNADDQVAALKRIAEHLVPGAPLLIHVSHDSLVDLAEMDGTKQSDDPITNSATGRRYRRDYAWTYDHAYQNATVRVTWSELDDDGAVVDGCDLEPLVLHVITAVEMEHALRRAGFGSAVVVGSFDGAPFRADSTDMIWTAHSTG
jgi:SAM-dependent methyltransferase